MEIFHFHIYNICTSFDLIFCTPRLRLIHTTFAPYLPHLHLIYEGYANSHSPFTPNLPHFHSFTHICTRKYAIYLASDSHTPVGKGMSRGWKARGRGFRACGPCLHQIRPTELQKGRQIDLLMVTTPLRPSVLKCAWPVRCGSPDQAACAIDCGPGMPAASCFTRA